ncbi:MAG TPA: glycosyltransferase [Puia sp.]|jgi:glycosyltransferase involved in cell wall biosynthesis|nr:glycosyltransferase [Puia sp.]
MKKICIVSTRHISYNPRVLKEADALDAGGYEVVVVTISNDGRQAAFDEELMRARKWRLRTVGFRKERRDERRHWLFLSVKQRLYLLMAKISLRWGIAERAAEKAFDGLVRLAKAERADLYIAHHAEALGAAYSAARTNRARFGFDAEDFHTGMEDPGAGTSKVIGRLERKYLPFCDHLTAASKGIAEAYRDKYGIRLPQVILNVVPLEDLAVRAVRTPVKFYWYSQVIGPNRGIELLLDAASRITLPFEIHLRGKVYSEGYMNGLKQRFGGHGLWERIFLHEPILPAKLISDANQFDIGLALESAVSINRNICVTNKVFSYLMSRLFIVGTDTYGQKDIFGHFPGAVRICRMDDPEDLADAMRFCIGNIPAIAEGKSAAGKAAEDCFNWEVESAKLRLAVDSLINHNLSSI